MISTRLTRLLDLDYPILQSALGEGSGAQLAAAVSNAGALGTVAGLGRTPSELANEIEETRGLTQRPFAACVIALNGSAWTLAMLDAALEAGAPAIALVLGDPQPSIARCRAAKRPALVYVSDLAAADVALAAKADVIVVQGHEAGGPTGTRGTLSLAAQVLDRAPHTPVVVAGGIGSGRGLAAALAMGGSGVALGTRFKATHEFGRDSIRHAAIEREKHAIVASDGMNTAYAEIADGALALVCPQGTRGRVLGDALWWKRREDLRRALHSTVLDPESPLEAANWAGEAAGLVDSILPAAEVVDRIVGEAEQLLCGIEALLRKPFLAR